MGPAAPAVFRRNSRQGGMGSSSTGSYDSIEDEVANPPKAQGAVKIDCMGVRRSDVQPGTQTGASMVPHKVADGVACEPLSAVRRVRADSAELRVAWQPQSLPTHCDQLTSQPDAAVGSHQIGPRTEKAGKRQIRERDHLTGVFGGERYDLVRLLRRVCVRGEYHLHAFQAVDDIQAWHRSAAVHDPNGFLGREQHAQVFERALGRRFDRDEWSDIGRIAARITLNDCQVTVRTVKRMPHGIQKREFRQLGHGKGDLIFGAHLLQACGSPHPRWSRHALLRARRIGSNEVLFAPIA